jgi:hypothetical protein
LCGPAFKALPFEGFRLRPFRHASCHQPARCLSWSWLRLRVLLCEHRSRLIGLPAPTSLFVSEGHVVFRFSPSPFTFAKGSSSLRLPLLQSSKRPNPPRDRGLRAPSLGFRSPSRHQSTKSTRHELPTARTLPPSEFLTPSTVCSLIDLAGLFHPAATSGIRSSGISPCA